MTNDDAVRRGLTPARVPIPLAPVQRTALSREEAAASMGVSLDTFERHIQPSIRLVRIGRKRLVPVGELSKWIDDHAEHVLRNRKVA